MFYALSDKFTSNNPADFTSGFANTKTAIAFETRTARDEWVRNTKLLTAKALTRTEAEKMAYRASGYEASVDGTPVSEGDMVIDMAMQPNDFIRVCILRHV